jgi:hypothetical protein
MPSAQVSVSEDGRTLLEIIGKFTVPLCEEFEPLANIRLATFRCQAPSTDRLLAKIGQFFHESITVSIYDITVTVSFLSRRCDASLCKK